MTVAHDVGQISSPTASWQRRGRGCSYDDEADDMVVLWRF